MATYTEALRTAIGFHQAGQLSQAEQIYRQILASFPTQPDALHLLGVVAHQSGRQELAVQYIGQAIAENPSQPIYFNSLGDAYRLMGNLAAAQQIYERALALAPNHAAARGNLGRVLRAQGRLEESVVEFRKALACDANSAAALTNLGSTLSALNRLDEAIEHLQKVVALHPQSAEAHLNLGCAHASASQWDRAMRAFEEALRLAPEYADARLNLANTLRVKGDLAAADTAFAEAVRRHPNHAKTLVNYAALLADQGRTAESLELCERALALEPNAPAALLQRSKALEALQRHDEARAAFQAANQPPSQSPARDLPVFCLNASHQYKCIFIHIPKNGGTSIKQVLDMPGAGHHTWREYATHYVGLWQQYASFAVVRNPWDRAVSAYHHARMKESHWHNAKVGLHPDYKLLAGRSFAQCVALLLREPNLFRHESWQDQARFVVDLDSPEKKIVVGTLLRFESLNNDFAEFCRTRSINCQSLPRVNTSERERDYRAYFTDETRKMIEDIYSTDIDKFGYSF